MHIYAISNLKSLAFQQKDAESHCNVGSPQLMKDNVTNRLIGLNRRDGVEE